MHNLQLEDNLGVLDPQGGKAASDFKAEIEVMAKTHADKVEELPPSEYGELECPFCEWWVSDDKHFLKGVCHVLQKFEDGSIDGDRYKCNKCGNTFLTVYNLQRHLKSIACSPKTEVCSRCGDNIKHYHKDRHLEVCCKCNVCSKQFNCTEDYEKHTLDCFKTCTYCGKVVQYKSQLVKHMMTCCLCKFCNQRIDFTQFKDHLKGCYYECSKCRKPYKYKSKHQNSCKP